MVGSRWHRTAPLPACHRKSIAQSCVAPSSQALSARRWAYHFRLYGTVTALVFGKLFFPKSDPIVGVWEAFSVFFIGFVGRPIGAFIFGHWGDRIGRKATLIVTVLLGVISQTVLGFI